MRATFVNESEGGLKIYKHKDGTYSAVRNSILYTFLWNSKSFKAYNFKKIGMIDQKLYALPVSLSKPHIQMILQVQKNINKLNEGIESILTLL